MKNLMFASFAIALVVSLSGAALKAINVPIANSLLMSGVFAIALTSVFLVLQKSENRGNK